MTRLPSRKKYLFTFLFNIPVENEVEHIQIQEDYSSVPMRFMILHRVNLPPTTFTQFFQGMLILNILTDDLLDLGEIGRGAFGTVNKMIFKKNNKIMAVKRIRCSNVVDEKEQKRIMVSVKLLNHLINVKHD